MEQHIYLIWFLSESLCTSCLHVVAPTKCQHPSCHGNNVHKWASCAESVGSAHQKWTVKHRVVLSTFQHNPWWFLKMYLVLNGGHLCVFFTCLFLPSFLYFLLMSSVYVNSILGDLWMTHYFGFWADFDEILSTLLCYLGWKLGFSAHEFRLSFFIFYTDMSVCCLWSMFL